MQMPISNVWPLKVTRSSGLWSGVLVVGAKVLSTAIGPRRRHSRLAPALKSSEGKPGREKKKKRRRERVPMCEERLRRYVREYRFGGKPEEEDQLNPELVVLIPEVLDPQYGMYVWPCAVVLAQYVWFHRRLVCSKRILELGAGVSLPGIVAAKCGAEVILSDNAEFPQCLDNCRKSCQMNHLTNVHVTGVTWGRISPNLLALPPVDIILASDVFFEPEDFEDIVSTVHYLMGKNPHAQFWTTYQVRSADWSIEGLLYKWEMESICVPLQSFEANKDHLAGSSLPGRHTVEMMVIATKKLEPQLF